MDSPIFQLSEFVTKQFSQDQQLTELLKTESFDLISDWKQYQQIHKHLDIFSLTRHYRKSRLALIAARDVHNPDNDYLHTLKQTSQLATILLNHVYEYCEQEFKNKYGEVIGPNGQTQKFIIYALGKLGGKELNYSSDIDLVFCYSGQGSSNGKKSIEAQVYFDRLGRKIIQVLDSFSKDGIVYRVDMRLRPFGNAAPLVCSVDHLLNYLQTEGRDWERYAWLRASLVAGDKATGEQTLNQVLPFIYRKYLDYSVFESLRQIKDQILRKQENDPDNIKLGLGGIREIEFIVQTLQLTFAGRDKQLQGNDLWQKLKLLYSLKHITKKEHSHLTKAWLFLRRLENLCQIINDQASHHVPDQSNDLAQCMGLENQQDLIKLWQEHRTNVHAIFTRLFLDNQSNVDNTKINPAIQAIKDKVINQNYPKSTKHKIYAALDALVPVIETMDQADVIISRYKQVLYAVSKRSNYLSMLVESPYIFHKLIKLISISPYFSETIAKIPSLLELLFEKIDESDFDFNRQWQTLTKKHNILDDEDYLEILCQFKKRMQFLIIYSYINEHYDSNQTGIRLSKLAEFILNLVIAKAWQACHNKNPSNLNKQDLIVIAYGSLAMKQMHLDSDFDIVFVLDQTINDENYHFVMRWIKRIIHFLNTQSYSGYLYQLDTQLRPNGNSGAVVVSKKNFEDYQLKQAWTWEHAALIKSRCVYANSDQIQWFEELRNKALCRARIIEKVDNDLQEMAIKLKVTATNEHHDEFQLLGIILKNAKSYPSIIKLDDFLYQLEKVDLISSKDRHSWIEFYYNKYTKKLENSINSK